MLPRKRLQRCELRTRRSNRARGFTLLEAVAALGILALGVLALAAGLTTSLRYSERSRALTQATYLVEQQIEIFSQMSAADVLDVISDGSYPNDPNNPIDPDANDNDTTTFTRFYTIVPDAIEAGVITITVSVAWADPLGGTRVVQMQTAKANL